MPRLAAGYVPQLASPAALGATTVTSDISFNTGTVAVRSIHQSVLRRAATGSGDGARKSEDRMSAKASIPGAVLLTLAALGPARCQDSSAALDQTTKLPPVAAYPGDPAAPFAAPGAPGSAPANPQASPSPPGNLSSWITLE